MKFKNNKGESIEIDATGWDPAEDWLIIRVRGSQSGSSWEGRDPCLTLKEAKAIVGWLESLSEKENSKITFMEPELEFHYRDGTLDIFLEWKLRPPWKPSNNEYDEKYSLSFEITTKELQKQAKIWETEVTDVIK